MQQRACCKYLWLFTQHLGSIPHDSGLLTEPDCVQEFIWPDLLGWWLTPPLASWGITQHPDLWPWPVFCVTWSCTWLMGTVCWEFRPLFTLKVRFLFLHLLKMKAIYSFTTHSLICWFHLNLFWILSIKPSLTASKTFIYNCLRVDLTWDKELLHWQKSIIYKESNLKNQWKPPVSLLAVAMLVRNCSKVFNKIKI